MDDTAKTSVEVWLCPCVRGKVNLEAHIPRRGDAAIQGTEVLNRMGHNNRDTWKHTDIGRSAHGSVSDVVRRHNWPQRRTPPALWPQRQRLIHVVRSLPVQVATL